MRNNIAISLFLQTLEMLFRLETRWNISKSAVLKLAALKDLEHIETNITGVLCFTSMKILRVKQ